MSPPYFSVIIPTFNREATIRETLQSVEQQTFRDFEVIVVDDGSSDSTCEVVRSFGSVKLIQQPNAGPGAARNHGATAATGKYLAFLDSDDLWFPWALKKIAEAIETNSDPAVLSTSITEFSDSTSILDISDGKLLVDRYADFLNALEQSDCFVGAGMTIVRRDIFRSLGGYTSEVTNCEDHHFMLCAGLSSGFVRMRLPIILAWRRHEGGTTQHLGKTLAGVRYLIDCETNGAYPGGLERQRQRQMFLTARTRPVVIECLRQRHFADSWSLFVSILPWNIRLSRWKFLCGYFWELPRVWLGRVR